MTREARPGRPGGAQTLARGGAFNLAGAVVQQGALFAVMALLATSLGAADVGRYSLLYGMLSLLSLLGLAGFRAGLTRFVATSLADDDPARLRGTVRLGMGVTIGASLLLATGLALAAPAVAAFYRDPGLEPAVRIMALTLPAATLADAALSATQGWRSQVEYTVIGRFVDPLTVLGLTGLVVVLGLGLEPALWALAAGAWLGALLASAALARRMRRVPAAKPVVEARAIFSFSLVSWVSALAATGLIWSGTLTLGRLAGPADVGVFTVAARLVSLAVFVMPPITNAFTPHMAHLAHTGQQEAAARAYGDATRWILAASLPAFVVLIAFPDQLLRLFGEDFRTGATVTVILAVGQLVAAAAGPCGVVLNMSGRVWISMVDNIGALALTIALTLLLVPQLGISGAAVAWSVSLVVANVAKVLQVRWLLGIVADGSGVAALVVSVLPALGAALLVRAVVDDSMTSLLVGIPVVVVVTVVLLVRIGLPPGDRNALRRAWSRRARSMRQSS
ncbi:MAG: lipopolysaccharide biosynthesis protein [Dermatophilaceae bacterium]